MKSTDHHHYAESLLISLSHDHPDTEPVDYVANSSHIRNAAAAMRAILCHRLFKKTNENPIRTANTTYEWNNGIFNCRNIADRHYVWTNLRRKIVDELHESATRTRVAYLLACSDPSDTTLLVWVLPEPVLYDSLPGLPTKQERQTYTVQIFAHKQRIEHCANSTDLHPYFAEFPLSQEELMVLNRARDIDKTAKRERVVVHQEKELETTAEHLRSTGVFDPAGIADAREWVLSSIVRRRGQPAFRQHLLTAYDSRCAITGCGVKAVLEAAHIYPYRGPQTNLPCNGLLLRTDLHTLFDLRLIAVDVRDMTLLVAPELAGSCYDQYHGHPITIPDQCEANPSREALHKHREESGL